MSKFKEYLNKTHEKGYEEMDINMGEIGTIKGVVVPYEYKGSLIKGNSPQDIIQKINSSQKEPLNEKEANKIRAEIVNNINVWLRGIANEVSLKGNKKSNLAYPVYPK